MSTHLVLIAVGVVGLLVSMGPLFPHHPEPSNVAQRVESAISLEDYLRAEEAQHAGRIKPGQAKSILWTASPGEKTPHSIVYLHGFSASPRDVSPLMERVAQKTGSNIYFARLTGHGIVDGAELGAATAQNWIDDAREALAIGRRLGRKVILTGTSTGALLASLVALESDKYDDIFALVLISPNFSLRDWRAQFISGPFGARLAHLLIGPTREFKAESALQQERWTTRYDSAAIAQLSDLVNYGKTLDFRQLKIPTLILYTSRDQVVDPRAMVIRFEQIKTTVKELIDLPQAKRHEFAGDALAPEVTSPAEQAIESFLEHVRSSSDFERNKSDD